MKTIRFRAPDCANIDVIVDGIAIASLHFWIPNRPDWASIDDQWNNVEAIARCLNELMEESGDFKPLIRFVHDDGKDFVRVEFENGHELSLDSSDAGIFGNNKDYTGLVLNSFLPVWTRKGTPRQNSDDAEWFMRKLDEE